MFLPPRSRQGMFPLLVAMHRAVPEGIIIELLEFVSATSAHMLRFPGML